MISAMHADKSLGSDGFTARFYQTAWSTIKHEIMRIFASLWSLDLQSFYLVNQALMVLLHKKKEVVVVVSDYRPIRLIHSFHKLFAKILSGRLAPLMHSLVKSNHSNFFHGHTIHDYFRTVQGTTKLLHARKRPCVLLKIDIAKAFDTISWPFLMDLLCHMGFSRRWINWISILLSTASTRILNNGHPGRRIYHARGLRQQCTVHAASHPFHPT
jgi:hypothetical protein